MDNFDSFYFDVYLPKHRHPMTKVLHLFGTLATFITLLAGVATGSALMILLAPFAVYPTAWASHFIFEGNKPLAFKSPFWSRMADWRMFIDVATRMLPLDTRK